MINIAIDGPAGAGKSTAAKLLSSSLGVLYLDTGAMYRAAALYCLKMGRDVADREGIKDFLDGLKIDVRYVEGAQRTYLDGADVSIEIRQHHMSKAASDFSAIPEVRIKLVELQREIAARCDLVLDGRDIGTYVLPNAPFKFYLTASVKVRARRRFLELEASGKPCDIAQIEADIAQRDYNDMNRDFAPLRQAEDAVLINSDDLTASQVVSKMLSYIKGENK